MKLSLGIEFEINFQPSGKIFLSAYDNLGNEMGNQLVTIEQIFEFSTQIYTLKNERARMLKNIKKELERLNDNQCRKQRLGI